MFMKKFGLGCGRARGVEAWLRAVVEMDRDGPGCSGSEVRLGMKLNLKVRWHRDYDAEKMLWGKELGVHKRSALLRPS